MSKWMVWVYHYPTNSHINSNYNPLGTNISPTSRHILVDDFPFPKGGICIPSLEGKTCKVENDRNQPDQPKWYLGLSPFPVVVTNEGL